MRFQTTVEHVSRWSKWSTFPTGIRILAGLLLDPGDAGRILTYRTFWLAILLAIALPFQVSLADAPRFGLVPGDAGIVDVQIDVTDNFIVHLDLSIAEASADEALTLTVSSHRSDDLTRADTEIGFAADEAPTAAGTPLKKTLATKLKQDQVSQRIHLDTSRITFGEDQNVALEIESTKGDTQSLMIRLKWRLPQIFQFAEDRQRSGTLAVTDTGEGLAFLDLGSFRRLDGPIEIVPEIFLASESGEEAQLQIALPTTRCALARTGKHGPSLTLTPTPGAHCEEIPIRLNGVALRPGVSYRGWLEIAHSSGARHRAAYIVNRAATNRAAVPVLMGTTTAEATLPLRCIQNKAIYRLHNFLWGKMGWQSPKEPDCKPSITLGLSEQSGAIGLSALAIGFTNTEPGELASSETLGVKLFREHPTLDGSNAVVTDLWNLNRKNAADVAVRSLAAGDRATLVFEPVNDLRPGEYKVDIQLLADNAAGSNQPEVELIFRIRWSKWLPFFILTGSVFLSYWISRGVGLHRRHHNLRRAVKKLRSRGKEKAFRSDMPPVVQARAELARIEKALEKSGKLLSWISVPEDLEARLAVVERRLPVLEQLADRVAYWAAGTRESTWVTRRAKKRIREVVQSLAATPARSEYSSKDLEALADLEQWEDPAQLLEQFWLQVKQDILRINAQINLLSYEGPTVDVFLEILDPLCGGFGKLQKAVAALNALRSEIDAVADAATPSERKRFAPLRKVIAVDPELIQSFSAELKRARESLGNVESKGLGELEGAVAKARDIMTGTSLIGLRQDTTGTIEGLRSVEQAYPGRAEEALKLVGILNETIQGGDWLQTALRKLDAAVTTAQSTQRERIRKILSKLAPNELPANLEEAIQREQHYAALKLIWEHRKVKVLEEQRDMLIGNPNNIEEFFRHVDGWAWKNLKDNLEISRPAAGSLQEELTLIEFEISPTRKEYGRTYLFKHGIDYEWHIQVGKRSPYAKLKKTLCELLNVKASSEWCKEKKVELEPLRAPTTQEPLIKQFIPGRFDFVRVWAEAVRRPGTGDKAQEPPEDNPSMDKNQQSISLEPIQFSTRMNDELRWRKSFQRGELIALGVAVFVAVVTGMQSDVFKATLLGSSEAYLALVIWGIASERATKLLANIDTYRGSQPG